MQEEAADKGEVLVKEQSAFEQVEEDQ